jgi:hypothetical protein
MSQVKKERREEKRKERRKKEKEKERKGEKKRKEEEKRLSDSSERDTYCVSRLVGGFKGGQSPPFRLGKHQNIAPGSARILEKTLG